MSYIRASTRVPGQRNASRTYAWHDVRGGVVIWSRPDSAGRGGLMIDSGQHAVEVVGAVRISIPEMHYLCTNFLARYRHLKGKKLLRELLAEHRGFYPKFDAKWEAEFKRDGKKWHVRIRRAQKKHKARLKRDMARIRKKPTPAQKKMFEAQAIEELAKLRANVEWEKELKAKERAWRKQQRRNRKRRQLRRTRRWDATRKPRSRPRAVVTPNDPDGRG